MGSWVLRAGGRPGIMVREGPERRSLRKLGCLENQWQGSAGLQTYKMERVILQLQQSPNYKEQLRAACREAKLGLGVLSGLTLCKMRLFWGRALRHYEVNSSKAETMWFQNELRLFHWLLLSLSCIHTAPLAQLPSHAWQTIKTVFFPKSSQLLRFEARKLISSSPAQQHRPWSAEEGRLLQSLMAERDSMTSWNEISRQLFQTSGGVLYRSGKQCREQWFNHLDPSKKHGQWTNQEDRALLRFVGQQGHRWAQICRETLPHRTEHMIKNRFKSLLQRHPQAQQLSERKLIRRLLKEEKEYPREEREQGQQRGQGNGGSSLKIAHLRTYHTEQGEGSNAEGGSLVDRFPASFAISIQIINNSAAGRQNYSQEEIAEEAPILPERPQQEPHRRLPAEEHEMNPPQGLWQQPPTQIQPPETLPISAIPTGYYLLYPSGVLWSLVLPGGCGQQ